MSKPLIPRNLLHTTSYGQIRSDTRRYQVTKASSRASNVNALKSGVHNGPSDFINLCKIIQVHKWVAAHRLTLRIEGASDETSLSQLKTLVKNRSVRVQRLEIRFINGCAYQDLEDLQLKVFRNALDLRVLQMSFVGYIVRGCIVDTPFNYRGNFKDKGLIMFGKEFRRFPSNLKDLRFYFKDMIFYGQGIQGLSKLARYMKSLKAATIHFEHCDETSSYGLGILSKNFVRNLTGLTQLNLAFVNFALRYRSDEELSDEKIRKYESYKWGRNSDWDWNLSFGVQQLLSSIAKHLVSLEHLNLNFYGNLAFFMRNFPEKHSLSKLQSLELNLSDCYKLDDSCMEALDMWIRKPTHNLSHIKLNFSWCYKITNDGFLKLFSGDLQHLSQLSSLILDLTGCQFITDEAVAGLFSNIAEQLVNLKKLAFFSPKANPDYKYSKITTPEFKGQSFLYVDLDHCPKITDLTLTAIELWFKSYLTRLKVQGFDFYACKQHSDMSKLKKSAEQPKSEMPPRALENLTFKFTKCNQFTEEKITRFVMILKSLCHLFKSIHIEFDKVKIKHQEK